MVNSVIWSTNSLIGGYAALLATRYNDVLLPRTLVLPRTTEAAGTCE